MHYKHRVSGTANFLNFTNISNIKLFPDKQPSLPHRMAMVVINSR